jgi:hypothetical protein
MGPTEKPPPHHHHVMMGMDPVFEKLYILNIPYMMNNVQQYSCSVELALKSKMSSV